MTIVLLCMPFFDFWKNRKYAEKPSFFRMKAGEILNAWTKVVGIDI